MASPSSRIVNCSTMVLVLARLSWHVVVWPGCHGEVLRAEQGGRDAHGQVGGEGTRGVGCHHDLKMSWAGMPDTLSWGSTKATSPEWPVMESTPPFWAKKLSSPVPPIMTFPPAATVAPLQFTWAQNVSLPLPSDMSVSVTGGTGLRAHRRR